VLLFYFRKPNLDDFRGFKPLVARLLYILVGRGQIMATIVDTNMLQRAILVELSYDRCMQQGSSSSEQFSLNLKF